MPTALRQLESRLKELRREVSKERGPQIAKNGIRKTAETIATTWFQEIAPALAQHHVLRTDTVETYSEHFATLLKLSHPNNLRSRYLDVLKAILKQFHDDLILPIQTEPRLAKQVSLLEKVLDSLPNVEESSYLKEAASCAAQNFFRAAAVLGWCAAIDRVHRAIEKIGFSKFNTASQQIATATSGRFKRFNSPQNVNSISELREVFDSNILWILEGMQLIDSNEHTRLRSCFELRCQCGHPGDAPVTEYNLLSFFSDITEIVLKNPKFAV